MNNPTAIWKLTIDPRGKTDPNADAFRFCEEKGIIGVGWGFSRVPSDKKDVKKLYYEEHDNRFSAALNIIVSRMEVGDYAWVYGHSSYYLCRICSDWWYKDGGEWDAHDIHNARWADWTKISPYYVPGIVRRKMTMYGAAQLITKDTRWVLYSHEIFQASVSGHEMSVKSDLDGLKNHLVKSSPEQIFHILDENETEDVVGLFLQEKYGWRMVKSSAYKSQRDVECEFTRVTKGKPELAVMQVKSGGTVSLYPSDYAHLANDDTTVYLFSTATTPYYGSEVENVICLSADEIGSFIVENLGILPPPTLMRLSLMI